MEYADNDVGMYSTRYVRIFTEISLVSIQAIRLLPECMILHTTYDSTVSLLVVFAALGLAGTYLSGVCGNTVIPLPCPMYHENELI